LHPQLIPSQRYEAGVTSSANGSTMGDFNHEIAELIPNPASMTPCINLFESRIFPVALWLLFTSCSNQRTRTLADAPSLAHNLVAIMYSYESTAGIGGIKTARENTLREFDPSFGRTIDDLRKAGCTVTLRNSAWDPMRNPVLVTVENENAILSVRQDLSLESAHR
jgi:hypothetical protein